MSRAAQNIDFVAGPAHNVFELTAPLTLYKAEKAAWHFLRLTVEDSHKIQFFALDKGKKGFHSIRVEVLIGKTMWETSLFPDRKNKCYMLPVKASVRDKENLAPDDEVKFKIRAEHM